MVEEQREQAEQEKPKQKPFEVTPPAGKSSGIAITRKGESEVRPPLEMPEGGELPPEGLEPGLEKVTSGKIPINPAVVKPLLRFEGIALNEFTGYPGWLYQEEDLENIAELVQQTGLEATPVMQLGLVLVGLHAEKTMGFFAWRKAGRPKEGEEKKSE